VAAAAAHRRMIHQEAAGDNDVMHYGDMDLDNAIPLPPPKLKPPARVLHGGAIGLGAASSSAQLRMRVVVGRQGSFAARVVLLPDCCRIGLPWGSSGT
jgi:hypothetical protein